MAEGNPERPITVKDDAGTMPHYQTGNFECHAKFLSDEEYATVLDCVVKACTDLLVIYENEVLIGKRQSFPQKDWWYAAGGRMRPGLSPQQNLQRLTKRELGLEIEDLSRFTYVGSYSYVWRMREQSPQTNGTA